jgi:hypothetical protein
MPPSPTTNPSPRRRDRAARVAVEELTGLALQERGLAVLLARHAAEAPLGGPRERLEAHLRQSREHALSIDERVEALRAHRGGGEVVAGYVRSGLAALGTLAASVGQVATLPLAVLRRGGGEERLLENAGVEGAALANKLVILTACRQAGEESGDQETLAVVERLRAETEETWESLLATVPELMSALVTARSLEPSYDFRTAGASDALASVAGPGRAAAPPPARRSANGAGAGRRSPAGAAANGS